MGHKSHNKFHMQGWKSSLFYIEYFDSNTLVFLCISYKDLIFSEKKTNPFLIHDTPTGNVA